MAVKTGIFVCGCRGIISDTVNLAEVEAGLAKVKKGVAAKLFHPWFCGQQGSLLLKQTILENNLDCIILAGCGEFTHREYFKELGREAGLAPEMMLRLDIRDGCAQAHRDNSFGATVKAINLIKMWVKRARLSQAYRHGSALGNKDVLVIGGGMAGLTASAELLEAGLSVTLVEKSHSLGGRVGQLGKLFPRMCDATCGVTYLINQIEDYPSLRVMTGSELVVLKGSAGKFEANIYTRPRFVDRGKCNGCGRCLEVCPAELPDEYNFGLCQRKAIWLPGGYGAWGPVVDREKCIKGCTHCADICPSSALNLNMKFKEVQINVGSIILAGGWEPYPAPNIIRLGYGLSPDIITNMQMERLQALDGPSGGALLCPGSGSVPSRVVFVQCAGSRDVNHQAWCSAVCCTASIKQAIIIKDAYPQTEVYILYSDIRTPGDFEELYIRAQGAGVLFVRANPAEVCSLPGEGLLIRAEDTLMGKLTEIKADLVVLATGVKPSGIPEAVLKYIDGRSQAKSIKSLDGYGLMGTNGFLCGHRQCFPMEIKAQGIYPAGSCQGPMDVAATVTSAMAAACKAMKWTADVPVSPLVPVVDMAACDKCMRCVEECPYGVWHIGPGGYPAPDVLLCKTCHVCMGACPLNCIKPQGFNTSQQIAMATAKFKVVPDEPHVLALMCENDAYQAVLEAGRQGLSYPAGIHVIPVRCAGSVNMLMIKDAIPQGVDGFLVAGCHSDQCHFISGADRGENRVQNMSDTLRDMLLEPGRMKFIRLGPRDVNIFISDAHSFVKELKLMGPSPFKNMA